jgi:acyl-CoA thioesterase-2
VTPTEESSVDAPLPSFAIAEDLATALDIEALDRDLFRGIHAVDALDRSTLYGGQVAGQALRAAGLTVAEDRFPHSLHGYFLRAGRRELPVLFQVDRDRDGRSFSARHVTAIQDGEVIFSMLASFHTDREGGVFDGVPNGERPTPTEAPPGDWSRLLDIREITRSRTEGDRLFFPDHLWVKVIHPLPDDRLIHACALTYVSDLSTGFGQVDRPGLGTGGPSIDHALWFQSPVRADDWLALQMWPAKAGGQRGVYFGAVRDQQGHLAAVLAQEQLTLLRTASDAPLPEHTA